MHRQKAFKYFVEVKKLFKFQASVATQTKLWAPTLYKNQ